MRNPTNKFHRLARRPGEDDLDALTRRYRREIPNFDDLVAKELASLSVGIAIAEARQARNLSQRELAKLADLPQPMIARLERPTNQSITLRTLATVATALNCDLKIELVPRAASSSKREARRPANAA